MQTMTQVISLIHDDLFCNESAELINVRSNRSTSKLNFIQVPDEVESSEHLLKYFN